jgi:hypothetical protein
MAENGNRKDSRNNSPQPVWREDIRQMLRFRLQRMLIGDAMISESTTWKINAVDDNGICFIVQRDGKDVVKRRKVESIIDFLLDNQASDDLELVFDGALNLLDTDNMITHWKFDKLNIRYGIERFFDAYSMRDNKSMPIFYWHEHSL